MFLNWSRGPVTFKLVLMFSLLLAGLDPSNNTHLGSLIVYSTHISLCIFVEPLSGGYSCKNLFLTLKPIS